MIEHKLVPLDYAGAAQRKGTRVAIGIMLAMAVLCLINVGLDFLLMNVPRIGDSSDDSLTAILVMVYLLGFAAAFFGAFIHLASKKSRWSYRLMVIFLITFFANFVITFIASQTWAT